jgi:hypothetical protein
VTGLLLAYLKRVMTAKYQNFDSHPKLRITQLKLT